MPVKSACANLPKDQCLPPGCTFVDGKTRKYCRISGKKTQKSPTPVKQPSPVRQQSPAAINPTECKLLSQDQCLPPDCQYINGKTRKYCARARKNQTSIKAKTKTKTNKNKKEITNISPLQIKVKSKTKRPGNLSAIRKIGKLVKSSSLFLNIVCKKSGACLAFGKMTSDLTNYFNGFTDFKYLSAPIIKIGGSSVNGFINEIEYERNGYKAHAILKTSREVNADNLAYEYVVGIKYINRIVKSFPCFVETYGLYFNKFADFIEAGKAKEADYIAWSTSMMKGNLSLVKSQHLVQFLTLQKEISWPRACKQSLYASILIQHIQNANTLQSKCTEFFINNEILYIFFIVYQALSACRKSYTHYDLHYDNVLIYEPEPGKYIEYHYHHTDGTIITFQSPYIPKIIDYGRSFFDNGNVSGKTVYKKICKTTQCGIGCGKKYGLTWLGPPSYGISSSRKNESHDLRLFIMINRIIERKTYTSIDAKIKKLINSVVYGVGIKNKDLKIFGTKEDLGSTPGKILNVKDAYLTLKELVTSPECIQANHTLNSGKTKLGDFHIYEDQKPMEFVKV